MKKLTLLMLLAGALVRQVSASTPSDLTLRVTPERDLRYSRGSMQGAKIEKACSKQNWNSARGKTWLDGGG